MEARACFELDLDTLGPQVAIVAPVYTVPDIQTEFWVVADEPLGPNHTVYVVDASGVRHDLILGHEGDRLHAMVNFAGYPFGIATIYAQVHDEVMNRSALVTKAINIVEAARVKVRVSFVARQVEVASQQRRVGIAVRGARVALNQTERRVGLQTGARRIEVNTVRG